MNKALLSSNCDEWETPPDFFEKLNAEFRFTLDPCALPETAKCPTYFTPDDDGLSRPWIAPGGGAVFCNPPYSRRTKDKPGQEDWIKKAAEEGSRPGAVVVMLIPARTDTLAFHEYIYHKAEIRFIKGRLRFRVNGKAGDAAPFPSMLVIFRGKEEKPLKIRITQKLPVSEDICPAVGETYNVEEIEARDGRGLNLFFIRVKGERVGVFSNECEVIERGPIV